MKEHTSETWLAKKNTNPSSHLLSVPSHIDPSNFLYDQGFSDGLPLIPCTPSHLAWMLTGTDLPASTVIGKMPPILAPCTVSNIAVNAVMAGCLPSHLRIIISSIQAMLEPAFNLHGCHATTMGVTPLLIINGEEVTREADLNFRHGAMGSGQNNRANATIGRAVKLVLQNCGRAKLGGTESTTIGGPRKFTMCLTENYEVLKTGPWQPFRVGNKVTVHAVSSGLDQLIDTKADLNLFITFMAGKIANLWTPNLPMRLLECVVIICPEHYKMLHNSGIASKSQLAQLLYDESNAICQTSFSTAIRAVTRNKTSTTISNVGAGIGYVISGIGWLLHKLAPVTKRSALNKFAWTMAALFTIQRKGYRAALFVAGMLALGYGNVLEKIARLSTAKLSSKMLHPDSIHIVVSGSKAGKFSAVCPGFGIGLHESMRLSTCVTKSIPNAPISMEKDVEVLSLAVAEASSKKDFARMICDPQGQNELPKTIQAKRTNAPPKTLGFMDISKPGGSDFFDRLSKLCKDQGVKVIKRYQKPTFSRQCPMQLRQRILNECDAVVLSLAD